jgi:heme exporter protein C
MAITTVVAYGFSMFYSIKYLSERNTKYDLREVVSARLGTLFCVLAAVSGSIFAKNTWGSYWNWDPRETSIFMLLLVYGAYFALRSAVSDPDQKANLSAVYSIFGFVAAIFFIFIMPRVMPGLHPGAPKPSGVTEGSIITFDLRTASVLIPSCLAYIGVFAWIANITVKVTELRKGN